MFHQTIVGKPKKCLNRNCRNLFTKESHLGWMPNEIHTVTAVMKCSKCKDIFFVRQLKSMAHEYKESLPKDSNTGSLGGPISKNEINLMRKKLENKDSLKDLMDGLKPNGTVLPDDDSEK
jgi:hypothetical protein